MNLLFFKDSLQQNAIRGGKTESEVVQRVVYGMDTKRIFQTICLVTIRLMKQPILRENHTFTYSKKPK